MQMLPCAHRGRSAEIALGRFFQSVHGAVGAAVLKIEAPVLKMATRRRETSFSVCTLERKLMFNAGISSIHNWSRLHLRRCRSNNQLRCRICIPSLVMESCSNSNRQGPSPQETQSIGLQAWTRERQSPHFHHP